VRLQLLLSLEQELQEWKAGNDKQKKKSVGQTYDHLDRGLDAIEEGACGSSISAHASHQFLHNIVVALHSCCRLRQQPLRWWLQKKLRFWQFA
jgi:hypothetical protein